jgi:hypothetical protein
LQDVRERSVQATAVERRTSRKCGTNNAAAASRRASETAAGRLDCTRRRPRPLAIGPAIAAEDRCLGERLAGGLDTTRSVEREHASEVSEQLLDRRRRVGRTPSPVRASRAPAARISASRADVDAARRLVEEERLREIASQRRGALLLVASESVPARAPRSAQAIARRRDHPPRARAARRDAGRSGAAAIATFSRTERFGNIPSLRALLGREDEPRSTARARRRRERSAARARSPASALDPARQAEDLAATRAEETGEAEHLAAATSRSIARESHPRRPRALDAIRPASARGRREPVARIVGDAPEHRLDEREPRRAIARSNGARSSGRSRAR